MKKILVLMLSLCVLVCAQKSTEIYIPIGKSPGLSDKGLTTIGNIESVREGIILVNSLVIKFDENTKFYLDKSKEKLKNEYGTSKDLGQEKLVEVKFVDNDRKKSAEWIKIEVVR